MFSATERTVREGGTEVEALKQRLGITDYVSLSGPRSLFQLVQQGLVSAQYYILDKTKASELINTLASTSGTLLVAHRQIQLLSGEAQRNAKSHWTKLAYRQQQLVKALNESAEKTEGLFKGRVSRDQFERIAETRELGISPLAVVAIIGGLVVLGIMITSAIKHYAEVNMYEKDIQATLETGEAMGMVASRASKSDPILGGLSEFFGVINWKAIVAVGIIGAGGLLAYYYLKTKVTTKKPALSGWAGNGHYKIPKVKGDFPENLVFDGYGHGLLID